LGGPVLRTGRAGTGRANATGKRRHRAPAIAGAVALALGGLIATSAAPAAAFDGTSYAAPISGASDFVTGFPTTPTRAGDLGPLGMIDDGVNFFVSDPAGGRLYKFPVAGGNASDPSIPTATGPVLTGLVLSNGVYFGTSGRTIRTFDPITLAATETAIVLPCATEGLVGDPLSSDLYVSTSCGVYRVQKPMSSSPTPIRFSSISDYFDGIAMSSDGQKIWAADPDHSEVIAFNRSGGVVQTVADPHGPDGVSLVAANVVSGGIDVSNNVFINNNDGTLVRVDTNNQNAVSIVAGGGSRGDFSTVGPDGCLYATQSDRIEKFAPCIFLPTGPMAGGSHCSMTAPTILSSAPGDASATVSWAPATSTPSGCIAGSVVTPSIAGVAQPATLLPGPGTTTVLSGLTNGQTYTFTVAAEDGHAVGPTSGHTGPITVGAPAAITAVTATRAARGTITLGFRAPRDNGAAITRYAAVCRSKNGGVTRTATGTRSPLVAKSLTPGKTYQCTVKATNSRGTGLASRPSAMTRA
jgi:hypothetical protein